jgi:hypothetical protein
VIGHFVITDFQGPGSGRLEAIQVAEKIEGELVPAGHVRFGFPNQNLRRNPDVMRPRLAGGGCQSWGTVESR